jgi:hypothetical protein
MHDTCPRSGKYFEVPFSKTLPKIVAVFAIAGVITYYLPRLLVTSTPNSVSPEFIAESNKLGNVSVSAWGVWNQGRLPKGRPDPEQTFACVHLGSTVVWQQSVCCEIFYLPISFQPTLFLTYRVFYHHHLQQRVNGPPVFRNPFRHRIPGNIVGPEDLKAALE